jgi:hypothetical protein
MEYDWDIDDIWNMTGILMIYTILLGYYWDIQMDYD